MTKRTFLATLLSGAGIVTAAIPLPSSHPFPAMNTDPSLVTVRLLDESGALTAPMAVPKVVMSDSAWQARLSEKQFDVMRTHGTERAFCGVFYDNHQHGL